MESGGGVVASRAVLRLTEKERYGIVALVDVALYGEGRAVLLRAVAARQAIPLPFLERIAGELRKFGYLQAKRGPGGGVLLARDPREIRLGELCLALVGAKEATASGGLPGTAAAAAVAETFGLLERSLRRQLDGVSIEDLVRAARRIAESSAPTDGDFVI
jgi:Rrf2 family iron-sulfur cluster assembly transcriptional regulator